MNETRAGGHHQQHPQSQQQRTMSASKQQYISASHNGGRSDYQTVNQSSQSSKIRLVHLEQGSSSKDQHTKKSGKQNKSFDTTSKNQLPPNQTNAKLNATLMSMIGCKGAKGQSNSKLAAKQAAINASFSKKSASRTKSASKGKAELFNSTAPLKFFTNLEETVRDIPTQNGANQTKISSSKGGGAGRQSSQNCHGCYEERNMVQGGTQQISVPKIKDHPSTSNPRPSTAIRRRPGDTQSKQHAGAVAAAKNIVSSYHSTSAAASEQASIQFNHTSTIADIVGTATSNENNNFVNNSMIASFQGGDYVGSLHQTATTKGTSKGRNQKSGMKVVAMGNPQGQSTQHNSKIKLRLNQQKTRSSSSISSAKNNFNNTQKAAASENKLGSGQNTYETGDTTTIGGKGITFHTTTTAQSKMSQAISQKGVAKMAEIRMNQTKLRQNTSSTVCGLQSETTNQSFAKVFDREQKVNKSFSGNNTTVASKKQRQTLRGMIEGLSSVHNTTTQPSSIPGSSSKRKTSHSQYMSSSMNIKAKRTGQSGAGTASNYGQQAENNNLSLSKTKDKIYTSYNYQSNGSKGGGTQGTSTTNASGNHQKQSVTGQYHHTGSKSSSSLNQLPNSKKNLNNSLLKVPLGTSATGNGNMLPQFARVDFDRLNNRKGRDDDHQSKLKAENFIESYQDISRNQVDQHKIGHSSTKGLSKSTQKAFLSSSNRLNRPKHSVHKSIEDSSSYFATCTASGPLNPFLEQILREIPNAYSGNVSGLNSAGATCALNLGGIGSKEMTINLNVQAGQNSSKASVNSKKALGKISKKIRSNMNISGGQKAQVSANFNLTTTAAALLAASDKNAPALQNTELLSQTFETRNSNSVNGSVFKHEDRTGALNSSKKVNKNVEGSRSLAADKRLALHKRVSESRGHIRLNSQKRLSKSSYSQSQNRKKETSQKPENAAYKNQVQKADVPSSQQETQKTNLSLSKLPGLSTTAKISTLMNVVKVAAKQKEGKLNSSALNQKLNLRPTKPNINSLNTTQVLEGTLMKIKIGSSNQKSLVIPQKTKIQSKSRGQLNSSTGRIQTSKKRTPTPQQEVKLQAANKDSGTTEPLKMTISSKKPTTEQHKIGGSKLRGKTNDQQNRRSNLKFDWSGFLSNMMHENFKPKNSTSGPGNINGSALYDNPYQLQQDMQNKTQPLPKNLIQKDVHQHDAYDLQYKGRPVKRTNQITYGANNLPRTESRGSDYRPRIGRKQIEIAPMGGAQKTNFAATMNNMQLKNAKEAADFPVITVLTELTESGDNNTGEKDSPTTSCPSTHRTPENVNQDYKFGRQLGEGAYAVVRLAYKKSEGKNYAAKIYDKSKLVDEHRRNSVCREVTLMQKLKHPNVVKFLEAFETDLHVYLIIEYVPGKSLHDYLKKQRASAINKTEFDQTLSEDEALRIIKQLLQCLEYLHTEGITHRDIKLENILLDQNGDIKIIDFGFSTCQKPQKKMKIFCGTPSYMAPEIVSRVEYFGPPADIWASAVLLFCLLNGFFPFKGQTDAELYRKINRGAFKMIRSDLSDDCLNVLKEMFSINPDSRITASELLQENWFLSDSSKKRSIAEIRREFKAKMLKKFPVRSMNKNTICIPAPQLDSFVVNNAHVINQGPEEIKGEQHAEILQVQRISKNADLIAQNSLALYRNVNQASPPSMVPDSQVTQNDLQSQIFEDGMQLEFASSEGNDDAINQEALLAYYNTSGGVQGVHPQASAPPSGKYNLNPYSAYSNWNIVQGSPPSVADLGIEASNANSNTESNNFAAQNLPASEYHPRQYIVDPCGPLDEPVSATDIEIIIAGKPVAKNSDQLDFFEYLGHEREAGGKKAINIIDSKTDNGLIYGAEGDNSTPANKQ